MRARDIFLKSEKMRNINSQASPISTDPPSLWFLAVCSEKGKGTRELTRCPRVEKRNKPHMDTNHAHMTSVAVVVCVGCHAHGLANGHIVRRFLCARAYDIGIAVLCVTVTCRTSHPKNREKYQKPKNPKTKKHPNPPQLPPLTRPRIHRLPRLPSLLRRAPVFGDTVQKRRPSSISARAPATGVDDVPEELLVEVGVVECVV